MTFTWTNSLEGITPSGTTVTAANSGGVSGQAFSASEISIGAGATVASDSTRAAHGALSLKLATGGTSGVFCVGWDSFTVTGSTLWFRFYAYHTANPAAIYRLASAANASSLCAAVYLNTSGTLRVDNASGGTILTLTNAIPLNAWYRVEGFFTFSATAGQAELKLFTSPDATSPLETQTTTAAQNTSTLATKFFFGDGGSGGANVGPFWEDDVGLGDQGYLGPSVSAAGPGAARPGKTWQRRFRHRQQPAPPGPPPAPVVLTGFTSVPGLAVPGLFTPGYASPAATALAAGAGAVTGVVTQAVAAAAAGPGAATQIAPAAAAGAGAVTDVVTQAVTAAAAGAGAVTAAGGIGGTGTASVAGAGAAAAAATQAAPATQAAAAALTGAGAAAAAGTVRVAFTVGALTAATAAASTLTGTTTAGATAGGVLTAATQTTGGPS